MSSRGSGAPYSGAPHSGAPHSGASRAGSGPEVDRFVLLIREQTGNVVPPARYGFLAGILERRSRALELPGPTAYLDALAAGELPEEWERLVPMVTIKESYFFRAPQQFAAIERHVLPALVQARAATRRLRVWSAACARGEETGTLALMLAETPLLRGWDWEVLGTDLDPEALETARRGVYGERALAHVPPRLVERWFTPRGEKLYELAPELRERIRYRPINLAQPPWGEGVPGRYDLVLLRNVLIYFRRPLQRRVVAAVGERLATDGALFLGASETLWQIQDRLTAYDLGRCFCYRHRPTGAPAEPLAAFPEAAGQAGSGWPPVSEEAGPAVGPGGGWRDPQIAAAAARRKGGKPAGGGRRQERRPAPAARPPRTEPAEPVPPAEPRLAAELAAQVDDDATHLHAEPCGIQERLAEAGRKLAANRVDAARGDLEEVLAADPSEPAAHALDGYLHDLQGETEAAIASYRAALYLDPALFQVRLLLADCLERCGWAVRAGREYREVLASLAGGADRSLVAFEDLLPDRRRAEFRCRQALGPTA